MIERIAGVLSQTLFLAAFILVGLALWEKLANMTGRTLVFLGGYAPARMLELTAIVLLFVIALELRVIMNREWVTKPPG